MADRADYIRTSLALWFGLAGMITLLILNICSWEQDGLLLIHFNLFGEMYLEFIVFVGIIIFILRVLYDY